ncbi:MAG: hypothetical protein AAFO02_22305, partial [Bacteroidota bacterium]
MIARFFSITLLLSACLIFACDKDDDLIVDGHNVEEGQVDTLVSSSGVLFVRTPEDCFLSLPDWPYAYQYVEIDGLRQAYAEAGPANGEVVLLIHGQPSWSYLYRTMMPVLAD